MAELTPEYLDKRLAELPSTAEIVRMLLPLREAATEIKSSMATKDDLKELRSEMNTKFDALFELLDVRARVERLERTAQDVEEIKRVLKLA
jgi:hypothetical protein